MGACELGEDTELDQPRTPGLDSRVADYGEGAVAVRMYT